MTTSMLSQIAKLQRMSVAELQAEWFRLYGEPTRSRNRQFLFRRLAWRVQELAYGGLSNASKQRIDALALEEFVRIRTPAVAAPAGVSERYGQRSHVYRDPCRPIPGTLITKTYKGRELRVNVREDGLELDGTMYPTATALAKTVTGSKSINGWLFLGVSKRKRS